MSKRARIATFLGLLGVVLLFGTVIVVNRELARVQERIETALTTALGRDVVIEGDVHVGLALAAEIVAEGIRIGNPDWASRDYLAYAERAEVQFELVPLIRNGLFIVSSLEFEDVDVRLEETEDGLNNWTFPVGQSGDLPLPQVHQFAIASSTIVLALPGVPERRLRVDELEAARTDRFAVELDATGALGTRTFEIEAHHQVGTRQQT